VAPKNLFQTELADIGGIIIIAIAIANYIGPLIGHSHSISSYLAAVTA
jgi:hypothetical protein